MQVADWIAEPTNWVYLVLALVIAVSALRVVTSTNVVSGGGSSSSRSSAFCAS